MKKTVTVAAYNRPRLLGLLLESLKGQLQSLADYTLHIRIDAGGDHFEGVKRVASSVDFMGSKVSYPKSNEGINVNTYRLMAWAFEEEQADWNIYLEDDLLLSPDAFNLVEWYISNSVELRGGSIEDIGAYCLCRLRGSGDPENVYLSRAFVGWGFLMDAHQWRTYAKPAWRNAQALWGYPRMWDNSVADYIRTCGAGVHNVFPELSRITNTGRVGTHFTARKYDALMQSHEYNQSHKIYNYRLAL